MYSTEFLAVAANLQNFILAEDGKAREWLEARIGPNGPVPIFGSAANAIDAAQPLNAELPNSTCSRDRGAHPEGNQSASPRRADILAGGVPPPNMQANAFGGAIDGMLADDHHSHLP
jgi:hypothetical protein